MLPLPINLPSMRKEYGERFDVAIVPKGPVWGRSAAPSVPPAGSAAHALPPECSAQLASSERMSRAPPEPVPRPNSLALGAAGGARADADVDARQTASACSDSTEARQALAREVAAPRSAPSASAVATGGGDAEWRRRDAPPGANAQPRAPLAQPAPPPAQPAWQREPIAAVPIAAQLNGSHGAAAASSGARARARAPGASASLVGAAEEIRDAFFQSSAVSVATSAFGLNGLSSSCASAGAAGGWRLGGGGCGVFERDVDKCDAFAAWAVPRGADGPAAGAGARAGAGVGADGKGAPPQVLRILNRAPPTTSAHAERAPRGNDGDGDGWGRVEAGGGSAHVHAGLWAQGGEASLRAKAPSVAHVDAAGRAHGASAAAVGARAAVSAASCEAAAPPAPPALYGGVGGGGGGGGSVCGGSGSGKLASLAAEQERHDVKSCSYEEARARIFGGAADGRDRGTRGDAGARGVARGDDHGARQAWPGRLVGAEGGAPIGKDRARAGGDGGHGRAERAPHGGRADRPADADARPAHGAPAPSPRAQPQPPAPPPAAQPAQAQAPKQTQRASDRRGHAGNTGAGTAGAGQNVAQCGVAATEPVAPPPVAGAQPPPRPRVVPRPAAPAVHEAEVGAQPAEAKPRGRKAKQQRQAARASADGATAADCNGGANGATDAPTAAAQRRTQREAGERQLAALKRQLEDLQLRQQQQQQQQPALSARHGTSAPPLRAARADTHGVGGGACGRGTARKAAGRARGKQALVSLAAPDGGSAALHAALVAEPPPCAPPPCAQRQAPQRGGRSPLVAGGGGALAVQPPGAVQDAWAPTSVAEVIQVAAAGHVQRRRRAGDVGSGSDDSSGDDGQVDQ
ncbi:hypothetical protein KFE25_002349 [Diacronema lutheri]|uniref:Uncharacterized protein n=1 Tax=Diacronema lutheri TaxID=2081491 RepID=A0A8J5XE89_DIALT|nr:hypothetical protein KFE25_002349 [Diacronema lutheri]